MTRRSDGRIGRKAREAKCQRCGSSVLCGLDGDRVAYVATVDPTPLTNAGELAALIAGKRTYTLSWCGDSYEIDLRTQFHIAGTSAENHGRVVADHVCAVVSHHDTLF